MVNERLQADAAMMMEALSEQINGLSKIQRDRSRLTATVTACQKRTAPPNSPERRYDHEDTAFGDAEPLGRRSMVSDLDE
ncbi:hypothetical protein ACIA8C_12945 [Nocardia sp. NPDC051321]|uniref:hypothetical protein n=1 Tax=Nocardia sp. NPDC051321 TaxID=3364323 RepID=UPI00379741CB